MWRCEIDAQAKTMRRMGVDEIYLGKKQKFVTVVSELETAEPVWFGAERATKTLDSFFQQQMSPKQRAGVDMRKPFRLRIEQWAPRCQRSLVRANAIW